MPDPQRGTDRAGRRANRFRRCSLKTHATLPGLVCLRVGRGSPETRHLRVVRSHPLAGNNAQRHAARGWPFWPAVMGEDLGRTSTQQRSHETYLAVGPAGHFGYPAEAMAPLSEPPADRRKPPWQKVRPADRRSRSRPDPLPRPTGGR
jgi:hypothetical protein